jgi:glutathione peroxidase-family protein
MIKILDKIVAVYNDLDCKETSLEMEKEGKTMVLNGGSSCLFTSYSYDEMKNLIESIRTSLIS